MVMSHLGLAKKHQHVGMILPTPPVIDHLSSVRDPEISCWADVVLLTSGW